MNPVPEQTLLPHGIERGVQQGFLTALMRALAMTLQEFAYRINQTAPKDGSELVTMTSYDSYSYPSISGDVDNAGMGYYTVVLLTLASGPHSLTGIANGAGKDGAGGRLLKLINVSSSANSLIVKHEDAGSDAENRILLPYAGVSLDRRASMTLWYDLSAERWRLA